MCRKGPQIVMKNLGVAIPHIRPAQVAAFMKLGSPMWEIWVEGCVKRRKDLFYGSLTDWQGVK